MTKVDDDIKYGMIDAISHLIHRDYEGASATPRPSPPPFASPRRLRCAGGFYQPQPPPDPRAFGD